MSWLVQAAEWAALLFVAFLVLIPACVPLGLVIWEVVSMPTNATRLTRAKRSNFRCGLRHIFLLIALVAILLGCCTWFGWTPEVLVICIAGLTTVGWMWFIVKAMTSRNNNHSRREDESIVISLPKSYSQKPPRRQRRATSHKQPDYGRYGMWK